MANILVELLQAKEPLFSTSLRQLEHVSGKPGVDVALIAEIIQKFSSKVTELGLDYKDSSGEEIYNALLQRAKQSDEHLAEIIGVKGLSDVETVKTAAIKAVNKVEMPRTCWALKTEKAKEMLRNIPPTNVMKRLGYDDIEALLGNEDIFEVYSALRFAEDGAWLNEFNKQYVSLTKNDFENRQIQLVLMPKERWGDVAAHFVEKKRHLNTHLKELGVVTLLPSTVETMPGITTKILSLTLHYYNEVRLYSSYFKSQMHKTNFGQILVDTLIAEPDSTAVIAGQNIHWRVIQRYFGKLKDEYHPEVFEPHVQPEDLHWRRAEEVMYEIDPELKFWQELDYVGQMYDGRPISMNLIDVSLSYSNQIPYDERYLYHFRESLWNEVFMRYMGQKVLEGQILRQLDNDMIAPESI